ncbi:alpha-1,6-mannosylglycoprotein 6-beta-N-acetylglucosaminyltransferase A-like isoform X2 [Montipora foliosa]|uniref:alpha-1,6-mannosylglycoprotein 6-beta-N-acetylglucosaminyltransferase A-like isoform X2 n=1 Tax=Montipora foliosa TaxID=591990 RepID=UPI0035F1B0FD
MRRRWRRIEWIVISIFALFLGFQCVLFTYNLNKMLGFSGRITDTLIVDRSKASLRLSPSNFVLSNVKEVLKTSKISQDVDQPKALGKNCSIPDDWLYPLCAYKVQWMKALWTTNKACYIDRHHMDPKDDCSILIFLSEVEAWCPILPWRRHLYKHLANKTQHKYQQVNIRGDAKDLFLEHLNDSKYQWMTDRITRLWPEWKLAAEELQVESLTVRNRKRKNIFLYMGTYSLQVNWLANAYKGVPLGEMVQWSDLIASVYALGHNVTISAEVPNMMKILNANATTSKCGRSLRQNEFDLIFTDYIGSWLLRLKLGPTASQYRCRLRILDSFGTEPEFNFAEYKDANKYKASWGKADVHLRQMMTMFPHSPDNLFLGFVVDKATTMETNPPKVNKVEKPIGVLYAKDATYLSGRRPYLDILNKYLEIHATIANERQVSKDAIAKFVPDYIINHGIMKGGDLKRLLRKSKVFIGLAFPYEGPAPLEAIAQGSVFINPKLNPPLNRGNSQFFSGKPTFRLVTSQHPYMETFVGKPHVYTIDINNLDLVESTVKEILSTKVPPFLPYEMTTKGMLERVNMFIEKLNFCEQDEQWPPLKELQLVLSSNGSSCKDACAGKSLICEPSFFNYINSAKEFKKVGISCSRIKQVDNLIEPSYNPADRSCSTQKISLLYSCVARDSMRMRLCPCRDYQPQQVAFCRNCS